MSGRGGWRGGGRPLGSQNKTTNVLRELAQQHTPEALATLVHVMKSSESDAARVSAANALLDRAYGKAPQALEHTGEVTLSIANSLAIIRQREELDDAA